VIQKIGAERITKQIIACFILSSTQRTRRTSMEWRKNHGWQDSSL